MSVGTAKQDIDGINSGTPFIHEKFIAVTVDAYFRHHAVPCVSVMTHRVVESAVHVDKGGGRRETHKVVAPHIIHYSILLGHFFFFLSFVLAAGTSSTGSGLGGAGSNP